jgi:hypothetical protein
MFRRVEGEGGDGGVEGYWLLKGGNKVGYQAKFFLHTKEIDWQQIDTSVCQALATHPTLVEYVVALPCDLTDRAGIKRQGKTGWQSWEDHSGLWKSEARRKFKRAIKFTPWTKSELISKLAAPAAAGLRAFFFGEIEFSHEWFERHVREAAADLDERYHPDDHVDVAAQSSFEFLTRHGRARQKLAEAFKAVRMHSSLNWRLGADSPQPPTDLLDAAIEAAHKLLECEPEIELPPWAAWPAKQWKLLTNEAGQKLRPLLEWA